MTNQPPSPAPSALPTRVVSLCPGATDSLCELGGAGLLVGRTTRCDHPAATSVAPLPGAHESVFADRLAALRPDVLLADPAGAQAAAGIAPAIVVAPTTVEGILDSILTVGREVGLADQAARTVVSLRERFFGASEFVNPYDDGPVTVFLESVDPLVCSGDWIAQLVERAGARHPLNPTVAHPRAGSGSGPQFAERVAGPAVSVPEAVLLALDPQRLILCPRVGGLQQAHAMWESLSQRPWFVTLRAVRTGGIAVVDGGRTFHRQGPGIVEGFEWLVKWLHGLSPAA